MNYLLPFLLWGSLGLSGTEKIYYGPHLTSTEPWENEINIFNNGINTSEFKLIIWNEQGEKVYDEDHEVPAMSLLNFVMGSTENSQDSMVLPAVSGSFVIETESGDLAPLLSFQFGDSPSISQFFLNGILSKQFILPNTVTDPFSWVGVAVMNPYSEDIEIRFTAMSNGRSVGYALKTIPAHSRFVGLSHTIWPQLGMADFEFMTISSEKEIPTPVLIKGTANQDRHLFFNGVPVEKTQEPEQFNLFAPLEATTTFLMENDGEIVHTWESLYRPGNSVYLNTDGSIIRTGRVQNNRFTAGGAGGVVQHISWDGDLLWDYIYSSDKHLQHHDIEILPNGNILMIAWELKSQQDCLDAGRNPSLVTPKGLWLDSVIEIEPTGLNTGDIVWEWHLWDHLIQNDDPALTNYGRPDEHPERVHFNFSRNNKEDWTHINSIDYNPALDQIVLSVHNFSEIWIIDHSTSPEESASHSGGIQGRGGDLLYRWGNPIAYGKGTGDDQKLFAQHDAEWIDDGYPGARHMLIFNNGTGRQGGAYSSVDELLLPLCDDGSYALEGESAYAPNEAIWSYSTHGPSFFASFISSSQRLLNGHTLICDGPAGHFFEVTEDGTTVWEYDAGESVFRVDRYALKLDLLQ